MFTFLFTIYHIQRLSRQRRAYPGYFGIIEWDNDEILETNVPLTFICFQEVGWMDDVVSSFSLKGVGKGNVVMVPKPLESQIRNIIYGSRSIIVIFTNFSSTSAYFPYSTYLLADFLNLIQPLRAFRWAE